MGVSCAVVSHPEQRADLEGCGNERPARHWWLAWFFCWLLLQLGFLALTWCGNVGHAIHHFTLSAIQNDHRRSMTGMTWKRNQLLVTCFPTELFPLIFLMDLATGPGSWKHQPLLAPWDIPVWAPNCESHRKHLSWFICFCRMGGI